MDQHRVTLADSQLLKRDVRRLGPGAEPTGDLPRHAGWFGGDLVGRHDQVLRVGVELPEAEDLRTDRDSADAIAHLIDHAGELVTRNLGQAGRHTGRRPPRSHRAVVRLHPGRLDPDPDLPGPGLGGFEFHQP